MIQTPKQTWQMKLSQLHDYNDMQIRGKTGVLKKTEDKRNMRKEKG